MDFYLQGENMSPELLATIRQALTIIGTLAVSLGVVKSDEVTPLIDNAVIVLGALSVLGSWAWSLWQKHLARKALAVATLTPSDPAGVTAAKAVLTPQELTRVMATHLPPATVSATGALVDKAKAA